jgi:hypothetical protein
MYRRSTTPKKANEHHYEVIRRRNDLISYSSKWRSESDVLKKNTQALSHSLYFFKLYDLELTFKKKYSSALSFTWTLWTCRQGFCTHLSRCSWSCARARCRMRCCLCCARFWLWTARKPPHSVHVRVPHRRVCGHPSLGVWSHPLRSIHRMIC